MGGSVAIQPLDLQGDFQQAADGLISVAQFLQPRFPIHGLLQRDGLGGIVRDQFRDFVHLSIRQAQHPPDIAHRGAGLQFSESNNLGDAIRAVFLAHVIDDLVAPVLTEIDVEIRHRHTLRVQKALEQQPEAQRIEVGDRQRPCNGGTGAGTPAWSHGDVL